MEVNTLKKHQFELEQKNQDDLAAQEQYLVSVFESKIEKKLAKERARCEDQLKIATMQLQKMAHDCEDYKNKAFAF